MNKCYCGNELDFEKCCKPLLNGNRKALTAEELMRSRYSAFVVSDIKYIINTTHPKTRDTLDEDSIKSWSSKSTWEGLEIKSTSKGMENDSDGEVEFWEGLEIKSTSKGMENDSDGEVEFIAYYSTKEEKQEHHELAFFQKEKDIWYFKDGSSVTPEQYIRETPKTGRNEPCHCGSGKKYKKCCGR